MSYSRQVIGTMASRVAVYAAAFGANILVARFLGPEGKGQVSLIILTVTIVIDLAALGIPTALTYYVGKKLLDPQKVFGAALALFGALVVVFGTAYWLLVPYLYPLFFSDIPLWLLYFILAALPLTLSSRYAEYIFLALNRILQYNLLTILVRIVFLSSLFIILVVYERSVTGVVLAEIIARTLAAIVGVYWIVQVLRPSWNFGWLEIRSLLSYGIKAHLVLLVAFLSYRASLYILRYYHTDAAVGQFSIALNVSEVLLFVPNSFGLVLFSKAASSRTEDADALTPIASRNVFLLTFIAAVALGLTAPVLVPLLFGKAFAPSVLPFLILLPGVVVFSIYRMLSYDIVARGHPLRVSATAAAGLACNIGVCFLLVPSMGAAGAAWGNVAGYVMSSIIVTILFIHLTGTRLRDILLFRRSDVRLYRDLFKKAPGSVVKPPSE
jgi:O-antigen/teichoic acid export membrane protein